MKRTHITAVLAFSALSLAPAQTPFHMSFANTSAATVMKVIATRTGTNIIFVGKESAPISLDVTVNSAEDAIRAAVSAGGLEYRKVNGSYIVAPPEQMRRALEPYSFKSAFQLDHGVALQILKTVQDAYPDATVSGAGDTLVFVGVRSDVAEAKGLIHELQLRVEEQAPVNDVVTIERSNPSEVAKAVGGMWPDLKIGSTGNELGGALMLNGPRQQVDSAIAFAKRIGESVKNAPQATYRIYEIKYLSATKLQEFMKLATANVEAFVAPETYSPKRALFSPLTSALSSGGGGSGSSTGTSGNNGGGAGGTSGGGAGGSAGVGVGGAGMQEEKDARARRLVLRGTPEQLDAAVKLLDSIDTKPQQIFVEVKVVEADPSLEEDIGLTWNWSTLQFFEAPPGTAITDIGKNTRRLNSGQYSRAPFNFGALLNAQIVKGDAKMLADPKVAVTDNDGASIFIGDTIRAQISQATGLGGQTVQIEEFPVGIILLIHPRINVDGNITMHVNPVVSTVTNITNGIPQTSSREAETTMIVKDGETIVLGGLIQDSFSKTITEVPFLSRLPIVGELFRSRSTSHKRTDVIITITPHIIKEGQPSK